QTGPRARRTSARAPAGHRWDRVAPSLRACCIAWRRAEEKVERPAAARAPAPGPSGERRVAPAAAFRNRRGPGQRARRPGLATPEGRDAGGSVFAEPHVLELLVRVMIRRRHVILHLC